MAVSSALRATPKFSRTLSFPRIKEILARKAHVAGFYQVTPDRLETARLGGIELVNKTASHVKVIVVVGFARWPVICILGRRCQLKRRSAEASGGLSGASR